MAEKTTLKVDGVLDHESGMELFHRARQALREGKGPLVLDMASVRRLDSLGGALLLRIRQMASRHGADVEFHNVD